MVNAATYKHTMASYLQLTEALLPDACSDLLQAHAIAGAQLSANMPVAPSQDKAAQPSRIAVANCWCTVDAPANWTTTFSIMEPTCDYAQLVMGDQQP